MPGTKKLVVSVSMDATKVIPALLTCLKFNCTVGMITPNHILAINEETLSGIVSAIDLAREVKAVVLMIHNCPEGFTPIKLLCIHPQQQMKLPIHSLITFIMFQKVMKNFR